jgi:hypothetical protein
VNIRILSLMAIAIGVMFGLTAGAGARVTAAGIVTVSAALRASEEVPPPTGADAARGSFTATVRRVADGAEFTWQLAFRDLTGPAIAAHIHIAPRGEAGPIIVPLCSPCTNGQRGLAKMEIGDISAMNAGRTYVNVHTARNPDGEIRGQVDIVDKYAIRLTPRQEVPPPRGDVSDARGGFTATITKRETNRGTTLRWRLEWQGMTSRVRSAHVHLGARGKIGKVIIFICGTAKDPCRNKRGGSIRLRLAQVQALEAGNTYVNVHTTLNPGGEIRGQLRAARLTLRTTQG